MSEEGKRKAAILLLAIGEEGAANVFQHLSPRDTQQIGMQMAKLTNVTRENIANVLEEFRNETEQFGAISLDSGEYIRTVLTKALGTDRAASLIEDILDTGRSTNGIDALNWLEPTEVAELIRDEHPQIIATLLVHLDRKKASLVLELFPDRLRGDVVMRIATFGGVQPSALAELTDVLSGLLSGHGVKRSKLGGVRAAAEILNIMAGSQEEETLRQVRDHDGDLAQRIIDEMFVFENLLDLEDRGIQMVLKEVESESLIVALKGAPDQLREKFLRNMSQRAAEMLREDLDSRGPVRISQVEAEQKNILAIVRRLADTGDLVLGGAGGDQYV